MNDPGMFWASFGAVWIFGCAIVAIVIWHLRSKRGMERMNLVHQERMKAMEKGVPLPEFPELDREQSRIDISPLQVNPRWPIGLGALFVCAGLGFIFAMRLSGDDALAKMWSMGMIGVFVGIGFILFYYLTRRPEK
jgi:Domain of unknown function (DUF6249)